MVRISSRSRPALSRHLLAVLLIICIAPSKADEQRDEGLEDFVHDFKCMVSEYLTRVHESGHVSNSRNRYVILAMRHSPQRFVQCIFFEYDTKLLCEASSGRFGPAAGEPHSLRLRQEKIEELRALGFKPPYEIANYQIEVALGSPPKFDDVARLLLAAMYRVYGARPSTSMDLTAPLVSKHRDKVERCKPLS